MEFSGGQDLISQLLSDLGEGPVKSGKENSTGPPAPGQFGRDLEPFFGDDGGSSGAKPLAEVPVEETGNAGLKKKKRGGKKGKGGGEDQASDGSGEGKAQQQGQKKKDKGKKKSGDGGGGKGGSGGNGGQQDGRRGSMWAGSAFLNSPAPEDVPMPSAGLIAKVLREAQKATAEQRTSELQRMLNLNVDEHEANDDAASSDLRRMLNIAS